MTKKVIIVGGGIAGLCTGCYARMNGYSSTIFEMHDSPGGLCTSWKRKNYIIDGCIHWLVGSAPGHQLYRFWEEMGAVQGRSMVDHEEYRRIEGRNGEVFTVYTNIDRLEQHMKAIAPEDRDVIDDFISVLRSFVGFSMPFENAPELYNQADKLKLMRRMLPHLSLMKKWGGISIQEFARRFKNPLLREAFPLTFDVPDFPMVAVFTIFACMHQRTCGYPVGGSLEFARAIEQRYLGLAGEVCYKSPVVRILVEGDAAVGVQLADGSKHRADIVISAADGYNTIFNMLDGQYIDDEIRGYYDNLQIFPPLLYISLGVAHAFDDLPSSFLGISFPLDEPLTIGGRELHRMPVQFFNFDPTFAPPCKTVLRVMLDADYDYWKQLQQDPELYESEKKQVASTVIALLDKRFPGLAAQVEMWDVATPLTFERYTGNWQGSYGGWLITTENWKLQMSKTLPGLANFYMVGQWVSPGGGLPPGLITGRHVIQIICQRDGKPFVATVS